jgi:DNA repair protein RAD16
VSTLSNIISTIFINAFGRRLVKVRMAHLDEQEEDFYQAMYTQSQAQFNTFVAAGTVLNNYAHIFDILIRLRQVVDHPYLVLHSDNYGRKGELEAISSSLMASQQGQGQTEEEEEDACGFCHEPAVDARTAQCGHVFCCSCVFGYLDTLHGDEEDEDEDEEGRGAPHEAPSAVCPQCTKPLSLLLTDPGESGLEGGRGSRNTVSIWNHAKKQRKSFLNKLDLGNFQSSTKMEALMQVRHAL